jgi:hypothetical protein
MPLYIAKGFALARRKGKRASLTIYPIFFIALRAIKKI